MQKFKVGQNVIVNYCDEFTCKGIITFVNHDPENEYYKAIFEDAGVDKYNSIVPDIAKHPYGYEFVVFHTELSIIPE